MELIGYTDKFSVTAGDNLEFKISTDSPDYKAEIVRLIHGDQNPLGPGFKEKVIESSISKKYPGQKQFAYCGSYVMVQSHEVLEKLNQLTIQTWVFPTQIRGKTPQGLLSKWWSTKNDGYRLFLNNKGQLEFQIGYENGKMIKLASRFSLETNHWYFVAVTLDVSSLKAILWLKELPASSHDTTLFSTECPILPLPFPNNDAPLLIGAGLSKKLPDNRVIGLNGFNGKIQNPCFFGRCLNSKEIEHLNQGIPPEIIDSKNLLAAWDFSRDISTSIVRDTGPLQLHGKTINTPSRAVTGYNWRGNECDFKNAPNEYSAIYFHEDDLDDAGWKTDFSLTIPFDLKSGIYAARLRTDNDEDYIPFFVRSNKRVQQAKIVFLIPSLSYLAYGNERMQFNPMLGSLMASPRKLNHDPLDSYLAKHPEFSASLYDKHTDGSGFINASRLRPITNLRPKYLKWREGGPRHIVSDLYLVDWLETKNFEFDILTDEDLHHGGIESLRQYQVVLTGAHPEYTTGNMLSALEQYLSTGGRLMYLGGNGFYWVTSIYSHKPHIMEVRRGQSGTRTWESAPGENYHSSTGELGGLWKHRGKPPNNLVGIGCSSMGWATKSGGYIRSKDSFDKRVGFIFEGIKGNEIIGNFGLAMGGAAGDELDRLDYQLGTPRHAIHLASSTGHDNRYQQVIEDMLQLKDTQKYGGTANSNVRADMVYFETPHKGAVFSVGSISWCGSLSHNNYNNNVSQITENVLKKFLS